MSYNIRYDTDYDNENSWDKRKPDLINLIARYKPDIFGVQEGLKNQVDFIKNNLSDYEYTGVGRDDGKSRGEYSAIFYNFSKFKLLKSNTFWLSRTPEKVSVGWDAALPRICTMGVFQNLKTTDSVYVFNTHFDHIGKVSRNLSAALIVEKIKELGLLSKKLVVMGDFNSEPFDQPIQILKMGLDDALFISDNKRIGPIGTFNGFKKAHIPKKRIDYVFSRNLDVTAYIHVDDRRPNGLWVSDHLPVFVEFRSKF
ncbi:MAG: endonuclease/exonuclease/phosphatase family protein [Bacteroidia bacterium]|nr:endonuclease/exonuclease/phosphatase family protein [Bacteroidia bacterium]